MNILEKAGPSDIAIYPFPHLRIDDALDDGFCSRLISEFPSLLLLSGGTAYGSNERLSYPAWHAMRDTRISPLWRDFIAFHATQDFFDRVIRVLGLDEFRGSRVGLRYRDTFDDADVLIDVQICANTPVARSPSSVRSIHLDSSNKLFVGLFYLRPKEDDSSGADLELYGPSSHSVPAAVVPYRNNTCVFFANSPSAFHAVSVRGITPYPRLFVNIIAETNRSLFSSSFCPPAAKISSKAAVFRNRIVRAGKIFQFFSVRIPAFFADRFDGSLYSSDRMVQRARAHGTVSGLPILAVGAGMKSSISPLLSMDNASVWTPSVHDAGKRKASYGLIVFFESWDHAFLQESAEAFAEALAIGGSLFLVAGSSTNTLHGLRASLERAGFSVVSISPCGGAFWLLGRLLRGIPDYIFHQYIFTNHKHSIRWSATTFILVPLHAIFSYAVIPFCALCFYLDRFDLRRDFTLGYSCEAIKIRSAR